MIYTIIAYADTDGREFNKNGDCRILRQPQRLLPSDIASYVENTKNPSLRAERRLAYTALFCGLKEFFMVEGCSLLKSVDGKPYLTYSKNFPAPKIFVSISHSEGACAVALSDEGEVGVDIQCEIDSSRYERLSSRFLSDVEIKSEDINHKLYCMSLSDEQAEIFAIDLKKPQNMGLTEKWCYTEAVLKCHGRGFGDISRASEIANGIKTDIREINLKDKRLILATSIEK